MTSAVRTTELTKRYARRTALADCTLDIPAGHVVGLPGRAQRRRQVDPPAARLRPPRSDRGRVEVLGAPPVSGAPAIGFVAPDIPIYRALTIADHLRLGRHLNPGWDDALARDRVERLGLDPAQRAGRFAARTSSGRPAPNGWIRSI